MFETPGAANVTLETLARLAAAFRTGLIVKFVPFSEMLRWENDFSQDSFNVTTIEQDGAFVGPAAVVAEDSGMAAAAEAAPYDFVAGMRKQPTSSQDIGGGHIPQPDIAGMASAGGTQ